MDERAVVTGLGLNSVTVESKVKSTCSQCTQVDSCASGQVAKALPHKTLSLDIETTKPFNLGDKVVISIPEKELLTVAWQVYLLPIIGLIMFGGLGQYLYTESLWISYEWQAIILSIFGGYMGYRIAKRLQRQGRMSQELMPKIKYKP